MNVTDVLKKAAAKKGNKSSTDMVEVSVSPGLLAKHHRKYSEAKAAKAELEASEEELLQEVVPQYTDQLKERYVSSARATEGDVEATIVWKDAYSRIPIDKAEHIKDLVGEKYDEYFTEVNEIVVREDVAQNPDLLKELVEAVGPDTFSKFFDVEQHVRPVNKFTAERYRTLSPEVNEKLNGIVRQHKPAVRVKG